MHGCDVPRSAGCGAVCRIGDLGEQRRAERGRKRTCEEAVLVESRLRKRKLMVTAVQKKTEKRINEGSTVQVRVDNTERLLR